MGSLAVTAVEPPAVEPAVSTTDHDKTEQQPHKPARDVRGRSIDRLYVHPQFQDEATLPSRLNQAVAGIAPFPSQCVFCLIGELAFASRFCRDRQSGLPDEVTVVGKSECGARIGQPGLYRVECPVNARESEAGCRGGWRASEKNTGDRRGHPCDVAGSVRSA